MEIELPRKAPAIPQRTNYLNHQKLGFWATVTEVNSKTNTCTVLTSNKEVIRNIPVATTKEWISDDSAERNLPPIGTFVFIIMPDNCISNAFILCSGYPKGEVSLQRLYAKSDDEKKEKDTKREIVTPGHWNESEDYKSGTRTITSPDSTIEIKAVLNNKKSEFIEIKAFGKSITLNKDGISISVNGDISLTTDGDVNLTADGDMSLTANSFNFNDGALTIE